MEFRKDTLCAKTIIQLYGDLIAPELLSNPMFERCLDECLGTTENFGKNPNAMVTIENGEISVIYPVYNVNNNQYQCIGEKKEIKLIEPDNTMQVLMEKYDAKDRQSNEYGWFKDEYEGSINIFPIGVDVEYTSSSYTSNGLQFDNSKFSHNKSVHTNNCKRDGWNRVILSDHVNPSKNTTNPLHKNPHISPISQYENQYVSNNWMYESNSRNIRNPFVVENFTTRITKKNGKKEEFHSDKACKAKVDSACPSKMVLGEEIDSKLWNHGEISGIHKKFNVQQIKELSNGLFEDGLNKLYELHDQLYDESKDEFFTELEQIKDTHPEIYEAYYSGEEKGKSM